MAAVNKTKKINVHLLVLRRENTVIWCLGNVPRVTRSWRVSKPIRKTSDHLGHSMAIVFIVYPHLLLQSKYSLNIKNWGFLFDF